MSRIVTVFITILTVTAVIGPAVVVADGGGADAPGPATAGVAGPGADAGVVESEADVGLPDGAARLTGSAGTVANRTGSASGNGTAADADESVFVGPDRTVTSEVEVDPTYAVPFWSGPFTPDPGLDPALTDTDRDRVHALVQFRRTPTLPLYDDLDALGYREAERLTPTTRYARVPTEQLAALAEHEGVRAVTRIRPEWRLKPAFDERLLAMDDGETVEVTVLTFGNATGIAEELELQGTGAETYYGELTADDVRRLQERPRVMWIDEWNAPGLDLSEGRGLVGVDMASRAGYTGAGVRVGVIDDGIRHGHPHFSSVNVVDAKDFGDGDTNPEAGSSCDHGTHVAGTIAGSGVDASRGVPIRGVAPDATLVVSRIFDDNCDWATAGTSPKRKFKAVNDRGADIISNSWGDTAASADGDYDIAASKTDTWAKNHPDTLVVFSNGNLNTSAGAPPASQQHVGSPGLAKNVIAVGILRDGSRSSDGNVTDGSVPNTATDSGTNNLAPSEDMEDGSGRRKPELYAPGQEVTSSVNGGYGEKSGTSMAAPHVSGVAALLKEKYPNMGANALRAELIATAAPPDLDGYGVVNANNALFGPAGDPNPYEYEHRHWKGSVKKIHPPARWVTGEEKLKRVENDEKDIRVPEGAEKLVVSLTWLDPGHTPTTQSMGSGILANDLDLVVSGPNTRRAIRTDSNVKRLVIEDPEQGEWTIRVHAHRVTAFTDQDYDVVWRTVMDEPTLDVEESKRIVVEPWMDRDQSFSLEVNATGAPVSGIYTDADLSTWLSACDGWRTESVVGIRSAASDYTEAGCVTVPAAGSTTRNYTVDLSVNTTNAVNLGGPAGRNATREVVFEVRPSPDADRFESGTGNDRVDLATPVPDRRWSHEHLRCYGDGAFSGGSTTGDCSDVLTDPSFSSDPDAAAGAVTAYEYWNVSLDELSLDDDGDEDFYSFSVPDTDTPALPAPECGTQNVTIGGQTKTVKTDGALRITVVPTANTLGDDGVRTAGPGTPITVYSGGTEVSAGTTSASPGSLTYRIDCPRSKGLTDLTVSFGEGALRNAGSYRIDLEYGIDITRPNDAASINRERTLDAIEAQRMERYLVASELLDLGTECTASGCSLVKFHPIGPAAGEDPVCRRAICRDPSFVTVRGTGSFQMTVVGHPDLTFELQEPTGEPVISARVVERMTSGEFMTWLTDAGYGQWVGGLGAEGVIGLMNRPVPEGSVTLATEDDDGGTVVAERKRLTVDDLEPGTYRLVFEGPSGNYWLEEFDRPPVPDDGDDEPEGRTVRLDPSEATVGVDRTTSFDVLVSDVDSGVGSYELLVTTGDTSHGRIVEASDRTGGTGRVEVAADGSSARLGAFAGDTDDAGTVRVASVSVVGLEPGEADLSVTVESVSDEAGNRYEIASTAGARLTVGESTAPDVTGDGNPAADLDGDGIHEDVNGDGEVTPGDASVLFNQVFAGNPAVVDDPDRFDVNGDGDVTPGDASVLFDRVF